MLVVAILHCSPFQMSGSTAGFRPPSELICNSSSSPKSLRPKVRVPRALKSWFHNHYSVNKVPLGHIGYTMQVCDSSMAERINSHFVSHMASSWYSTSSLSGQYLVALYSIMLFPFRVCRGRQSWAVCLPFALSLVLNPRISIPVRETKWNM
jgi:hypothetical protein